MAAGYMFEWYCYLLMLFDIVRLYLVVWSVTTYGSLTENSRAAVITFTFIKSPLMVFSITSETRIIPCICLFEIVMGWGRALTYLNVWRGGGSSKLEWLLASQWGKCWSSKELLLTTLQICWFNFLWTGFSVDHKIEHLFIYLLLFVD